MGRFTKIFVIGIFGLLMLGALSEALGGHWGAAAGFAVLAGFVAFIGGVGQFTSSLKVPTNVDAPKSNDLFSAAKFLAQHNPGWRGRLLRYGVPAGYGLLLLIAAWRLFK